MSHRVLDGPTIGRTHAAEQGPIDYETGVDDADRLHGVCNVVEVILTESDDPND